MRRMIVLTAALAALAACGKKDDAKAPAPAQSPAALAGPLSYEKKTSAAEVSLTLPDRVGRLPALYAKLYSEGRNTLDAFAAGAVEDVEGMKAAGLPATPYEKEIEYAVAAETPRLLSLTVTGYENTGGAHPNGTLDGFTWDKAAGKAVTGAELFRADADLAGADKALCDAVKAAKRERTGDDTFAGEPITCPTLRNVHAVLTPSSVKGKAAGLTVLFSPYEIGPYAEGSYEIVLPFSAFRAGLSPDYAGEFEGAPVVDPAAPE